MQIAARLSDPLLTTLRIAVTGQHTVVPTPSLPSLADVMERHAADVLVVEPTQVVPHDFPGLLRLVETHPATPLVVYTVVTTAAMRGTVEFARAGIRHVVLKGFDDTPRRFSALLEELAEGSWESAVFAAVVRPRMMRAPAALEHAVEQLFRFPADFRDVDDLSRIAGMHRRNVERGLSRLGIASAKMLVVCARVERAFELMRRRRFTVQETARRMHYPSTRLFARQVVWATGRPPSALRSGLTPGELCACLTSRLDAGHPAPGPPVRRAAGSSGRHGRAVRGSVTRVT